ncbi:DUF2786 domain-containing protein [Nocardia thailandica]
MGDLPVEAARSGDPGRVAEALATVAVLAARGDTTVIERFTAQVSGEETAAGADLAAARFLDRAIDGGWSPADLHAAALRRLDAFATGYLTDRMAAHRTGRAADAGETWRDQLGELGAAVWWDTGRPHLPQWAERALLTDREAQAAALHALALLAALPRLHGAGPAAAPGRPAHRHVDARALGRVRGLLAKAESTAFPEEAETLSAKAQELMTRHAIDHALLAADDPDRPAARRIWLDTPYTDAKALLVDRVARANGCRAIFLADWGFVTVVGDDADLDGVELLATSLMVQATRTMIDTPGAAETRSRHYRKAFLTAYAARIGDRLAAAAAATVADAPDTDRLLPALAARTARVERAFDTYFPAARAKGITLRSAEGWEAGTAAADQAHLGGG